MIKFLVIDGPLKGETIKGNFNSQKIKGTTYNKHTYALQVTKGNTTDCIYIDVATPNNPPPEIETDQWTCGLDLKRRKLTLPIFKPGHQLQELKNAEPPNV